MISVIFMKGEFKMDAKENVVNINEAILAATRTNAYFLNLLRLQISGTDVSKIEVVNNCMKQVDDIYNKYLYSPEKRTE